MKKYILLILGMFFVSVSKVDAYIYNDCVDNGTCRLLCNYANRMDNGKTRDLSIYYYFDTNEFELSWNVPGNSKKGPMDFVFSTSGEIHVYGKINEQYTLSNFVCPQYGFIDLDKFNPNNELCFDNDGTSCSTTYSNFATSFGIVADYSMFVSHKKDYDFEKEVEAVLNVSIEKMLDEISKGDFNIETDVQTLIEKKLEGYLYGHAMPPFMINYPAITNFKANLSARYEERKAAELKKASTNKTNKEIAAKKQHQITLDMYKEDFLNGRMTREEYDEAVAALTDGYEKQLEEINKDYNETTKNWENTLEDITKQVDLAFRGLSEKVNWSGDFKVDNCESYLGNPKTKGSPAYYLQFIFNLIKYAAIILLFALSAVEMAKAMTSNNQDALKKALNVTIKRLLIAVIIFFLPELIKFLLTILGMYSPSTCGIS